MSALGRQQKQGARAGTKNSTIVHQAGRLANDFWRYLRVIRALLIQEEDARRRAPFESILMLMEPVAVIATIMLLRYFFERSAASGITSPLGGSVVLFYATGFYLKYLFIYISIKKIHSAAGSPHRRFPVEQRLDGLIVHVLVRVADWIILGVILCILLSWYDIPAVPSKLLTVVGAFGAIIALGFGWGVFNMVMRRFFWFWHYVAMVLNRVLIVLSGCLFVPEFLAPQMRYWISFNPEMHAIALFRTAFYPHYPMTLLDTTYMSYCALFAVLFGLALERVTRRFEQ